jgi:DNA-binding Xre family transcriptional regulator
MAQINLLVNELKRRLKDGKVTYADLAKSLKLSESSVKRMFAKKSMSLQRLEEICNLLRLEISDIVETMHGHRQYLTELTRDQEAALVADPKLLLFAFLLVNGWQIEEITTEYAIDGPEAERLLIRLHRAKIVELLPLNRFKLLTARNFTWRRNGPVQKFFEEEVQREFLAADFTTDIARFRFVAGRLSRAAIAQMQNAIERIGQEFDQLVERDFALPRAERPVCGAVFAIRPWEFSQFARFKRGNDKAAAKTILQP